jgi:hypothetical protein
MKRKRIAQTREIDGRVYRLYKEYGSRYDARIYRDRLRKKGKSARIIESSGVSSPYALYVR